MKDHSFAQYGQDRYVHRFFERYPPRYRFFVDVGAFDGITHSNTRLLYELGWSGVCIEASPENVELLKGLYADSSRVSIIHSACSDYEGTATLHVATTPTKPGSEVSSLDERQPAEWPDFSWHEQEVRVSTITRLLQPVHPPGIDFLSVDVEGEDFKVLKGLDVAVFAPSLIVVEHNKGRNRTLILQWARSHGYYLWLDNGIDVFLTKGWRWRLAPGSLANRFAQRLVQPVRDKVQLRGRIRRGLRLKKAKA